MEMESNMIQTLSSFDSDMIFHLEKALEKEEFVVYYQPVIHTMSGSLCGFEALVRWNHPSFGLLMPMSFMPLLEEYRQVYRLDSYVVEQVCKRYREELDAGRPVVPISVNLSRKDFEMTDMYAVIEACIERYGMPRNMLNVEITESAFTEEPSLLKANIQKLRSAGYQIWMDDFGSGYSSLNTLKDFSFDELKIDMKFLSDTGDRSRKIIRSIISMAKDIDMVTLAEGVETAEQVEFLKEIGCDRLQGYYYSKPMPYDDVVKKLAAKRIPFESEGDRRYYHEINRINLLSPSPFMNHEGLPLAVMEYDAGNVQFLYTNEEFLDKMRILGVSTAKGMLQKLPVFGIISNERIQESIRKNLVEGQDRIDFVFNGDYCSIRTKCISDESDKRYAILMSVTNITQTMDVSHQQLMDSKLMNIYALYMRVVILKIQASEMTVVLDRTVNNLPMDGAYPIDMLEKGIHPGDLEKFREFIHIPTLERRLLNCRNGFINVKLNTLDANGEYSQKMILLVPMGNHEILFLERYANL